MANLNLKKKYHWLTPWLLLLVFFGPWLAAQLIYAKREQLTFQTLEKGILVSPAIPVQSLAFYDSAWLGKWQIIYMDAQNLPIKTNIEPLLKQLHCALGKEKHRVSYQIITTKDTSLQYLAPGEIALIDPHGWLMMRYLPNADPVDMLKDIRRLLRHSHG